MDSFRHPKELEDLLRAQRIHTLGTLAGGIAHDLNNVLAPISMGLELLRRKCVDEEAQRTLDTLDSCVTHGADLIRQILTFARGLEGDRISIQTKHLLRDVRRVLQQTLPKSITIHSKVQTDLWAVFGDPTQLHQVLMNLCINARDAMPGGGTLTINAENLLLNGAGPHVVLEIRDSGHGIPLEIRSKIFEPFFTTKETGKGTGLGLSMVAAIVRNHGGFTEVESELGAGTSFKIYFPALTENQPELVRKEIGALPVGFGELILVVDDEAAVREIAKITLESHGYRVLEAVDGDQAVKIYNQQKQEIKLVISDMEMPVMNGAAMIRALEKICPQLRVISASGMISTSHPPQNTVPANPFHVVLPKPFTAAELLHAVRNLLDAK